MHTVWVGALPSVGPHWRSNSSPRPHPAVLPVSTLQGGERGRVSPELQLRHSVTEERPHALRELAAEWKLPLLGSQDLRLRISALPSPKAVTVRGAARGSASASFMLGLADAGRTPCVCLPGCLSFPGGHCCSLGGGRGCTSLSCPRPCRAVNTLVSSCPCPALPPAPLRPTAWTAMSAVTPGCPSALRSVPSGDPGRKPGSG